MRLFYCFCRIYRKCLLYIAFRLFLKVKQVFNISFRPLDGRKFQVLHFKARCFRRNAMTFSMTSRCTALSLHNALFPDLFSSCFKLRLDQAYYLPVFVKKLPYRKQNLCQGNKRNINGSKIRPVLRCAPASHTGCWSFPYTPPWGSWRSFQSSWPCPTSTEYTFTAPF